MTDTHRRRDQETPTDSNWRHNHKYSNRAIMAALTAAEAGRVTTQAMTMLRNKDQSTLALDLSLPTSTMEPTLQWVVEMGRPSLEAASTVRAAPTSMQNPLEGLDRA